MLKEAIAKLVEKEDLTYEVAEACMDEIMSGNASELQVAAYLTALRMKGETIDEIVASAQGMRKHATRLLHDMDVLEIVGTGGDEAYSFNISTTASIVAAAAGIPVAKHGNRSVSSKCGAADVLEQLGVNITLEPDKMLNVLKEQKICFMFAQIYHKAMRFVAPVRRDLGIRTVFNILGPLTNPAGANMELLGVYDEALVEPLAKVMMKLGVKSGMVVYGQDRLDEISISAKTTCCEIRNGETKSYIIDPTQFGFEIAKKEDMEGGDPAENAKITKAILSGEKGPKTDAVILNAGAAIYIANDKYTLEEAIAVARETIESGKALAKLQEFVTATNV